MLIRLANEHHHFVPFRVAVNEFCSSRSVCQVWMQSFLDGAFRGNLRILEATDQQRIDRMVQLVVARELF